MESFSIFMVGTLLKTLKGSFFTVIRYNSSSDFNGVDHAQPRL